MVMMVAAVMVMMMMAPVILADAAHVVMMPRLGLAHRLLKSGQLHAILAQLAVHVRLAMYGFVRPLGEYLHQERMHVEIRRT
jgi:hypothetical protein